MSYSTSSTLPQSGGYCRLNEYGLMEIQGPDAARFLQAQTTNDVGQLKPYSHQESCLLDRKAHIQAYFDLYRKDESFCILAELQQVRNIVQRLDEFRFADKVEFLDLSDTSVFFALQGPKCVKALRLGLNGVPNLKLFEQDLVLDLKLWGYSVCLFRKSLIGSDGFFLKVERGNAELFFEKLKTAAGTLGFIELSNYDLETTRIEAGMLKFGVDFSCENFLPETGLDHHVVSYTKGCFLGQEVLARVRSQGAPTRGLVGILFPPGQNPSFELNTKMIIDNHDAISIRSNVFSPSLDRTIALAYVKREYRVPGQKLTADVNGRHYEISVIMPPFLPIQTSGQLARQLYERAIKIYAFENDLDPQSESVILLTEALELDPLLEDAYESLGVILSNKGRLEEAISLMKRLSELNPDSVMAHTNLSVFYMQKGLKEEAEEEKAISMSIRMKLAAQQALRNTEEQGEKAKLKEETKERMEMFKQVLDVDSNDLLANYGVGSCHVALGEFSQALPYLKKAIEIKSSHTVAYVTLGEAYEGLGSINDAITIYEKGIEVAAKKGDMMPLQDMQKKVTLLNKA